MNKDKFSALLEDIRSEASVLFLGQNYLASLDGENSFTQAINQQMCGGNLSKDAGYSQIWESLGGSLSEDIFMQMTKVVSELPTQWWLRKMLSLRWGMVYTSAVDGCITNNVGPDFSLSSINNSTSRYNREFMNKRRLHSVFLYGSIQGDADLPPSNCDDRTMHGLRRAVEERIRWIYDDALDGYGVFVIDGWNPETDWASMLLRDAGNMLPGSVYLFGVSQHEVEENKDIRLLVEDGIVQIVPERFGQLLAEYGYLDDDDELTDAYIENTGDGKTVEIKTSDKQSVYLNLPALALDALDSSVTVMHDALGQGSVPLDTLNAFLNFLQQGTTPAWQLYNPRLGFYVERDADADLLQGFSRMLKTNSSRRSVIVLEGDSNTGKTTTLANFALALRDLRRCPVVFISGRPTQSNFVENLKRFIKSHLQKSQSENNEWIDDVVIIWDNNLDSFNGSLRQYKKLAKDLLECNAIVVGSTYRGADAPSVAGYDKPTGAWRIPFSAELTGDEAKALRNMLHRIDPNLCELLDAEMQRKKGNKLHLLNVLQRLAQFSYSPEWKEVAQLLQARFDQEVVVAEGEARQALDAYKQAELSDQVEEKVVQLGVGASWQMKLRQYQIDYAEQLKTRDEEVSKQQEVQQTVVTQPLSDKVLKMKDDIEYLNQLLAVAGQFKVELPLSLLLRTIQRDRNFLGEESQFVIGVLKNDSLVRYDLDDEGYAMVRFRNPGEALMYVEKNFGEGDVRKEEEVKLLCTLIEKCKWGQEDYSVLSLVRKFGPNSNGKEEAGGRRVNHGKYYEYVACWPRIAATLSAAAADNAEAVLVYSHFLRERYRYDIEHQKESNPSYLTNARQALQDALDYDDYTSKRQKCRLLVEVCANYVASMPKNCNEGSFDRDILRGMEKFYREAITNWKEQENRDFTTNALLDIWLNAVSNFKLSFESLKEAQADSEFLDALSSSVQYIDRLLDLNTLDDSNLLGKVFDIYDWLGSDNLDSIKSRLSQQGNDTCLYLDAWRCWLTGRPKPVQRVSLPELIQFSLSFLPDDANRNAELQQALPDPKEESLQKLKNDTVNAAQRAIDLLEGQMSLIEKARSSRCLEMLIKAKWLVYTGYLPLEEKQVFKMSRVQWREIYELCESYMRFCSLDDIPASIVPQLIQSVYLWMFTGDVGRANDSFKLTRQTMDNAGKEWFVERIGLCNTSTGELYHFTVDIRRNASGRLTASIHNVVGVADATVAGIKNRYGLHVSDHVMAYLFDGMLPAERYAISKPVVIWFNAAGPSLGIPPKGRPGEQ